MAFIADCFEGTVAAVDAKIAAGESPSPTIISYILRDQTHKAQGLLRKQSSEVMHALCVNGFATIGWDFNKNKGVGETPPDIDKVQAMLRATAAKIRTAVAEENTKIEPMPAELQDLSKAADRLWQLDINRLTPENGDYEINLQEGKRWGDKRDVAPERLFVQVSRCFMRRPSFSSFLALLNNYDAQVGKAEVSTTEQKAEMARFLDAILATPAIRYAHAYLAAKQLSPPEVTKFRQQLWEIWFQPYNRSRGVKDSSGFEHVFIGEVKGEPPVVVGCHNWLKIYVEERLRRFDYKGYIHPRVRGGRMQDPLNTEQLIAINFTWQGVEKDASTIFIGTE